MALLRSSLTNVLSNIINPVFGDVPIPIPVPIPPPNNPPSILSSVNAIGWFEPEYYKTDPSSIVFGAGSFVQRINDRNNNAPFYTQGSGSKQPEYIPSTINGKAALKFDNVDDAMLSISMPIINSDYTIITVFNTFASDDAISSRFIQSTTNDWYVGINNGHVSHKISTGVVTDELLSNSSQTYITIAMKSGVTPSFYVNGVDRTENTPSASIPSVIDWGASGTVTNEPANGYLLEYIVINKALSIQELIDVQQYLDRKYFIPDLPLTVDNIYWMDMAKFYSLIVLVGDKLQEVDDRNEFGLKATQTISVDQPLYIPKESSTDYKDMPVARFDGISDYLSIADDPRLSLTQYTIFVVTKSTDTGGDMGLLTKGEQGQENYDFLIFNDELFSANQYTDLVRDTISKSRAIGKNTTSLLSVRLIDQTSRELFKDGQFLVSDTDNAGKTLKENVLDLIIGRDISTGDRYLDGDIADILIFNKPLSDNEMADINKMLLDKHSIIPAMLFEQADFWLDANKGLPTPSVTKNGSNLVSAWDDRNANGISATQVTATNQPLFVENAINILPAIRFNGIDNYLSSDTLANFIANPYSITFVVQKLNEASGRDDEHLLAFNTSAGGNAEFFLFQGTFANRGKFTNITGIIIDEDLRNTVNIITLVYDGTNLTTYRNGVQKSQIVKSPYPDNTGGFCSIGMEYDAGPTTSNFFTGDLSELIMIPKAISNNERKQIETYARNKYSLLDPIYYSNDNKLWLDATQQLFFKEAESTPIINNEQVFKWRDLGGDKLVEAIQATSTNQPRYLTSQINGLPAVNFDGLDNYLTVTDTNVTTLANSPHSIIFVVKPSSNLGETEAIMAWNNASGGNKELILIEITTGFLQMYYSSATDIISENIRGVTSVISIVVNGSNIATYRNGVLKSNLSKTLFGTAAQFNIGMELDSTSPSNFYEGLLGEVLLYSRVLTDTERQTIENDLIKKWI